MPPVRWTRSRPGASRIQRRATPLRWSLTTGRVAAHASIWMPTHPPRRPRMVAPRPRRQAHRPMLAPALTTSPRPAPGPGPAVRLPGRGQMPLVHRGRAGSRNGLPFETRPLQGDFLAPLQLRSYLSGPDRYAPVRTGDNRCRPGSMGDVRQRRIHDGIVRWHRGDRGCVRPPQRKCGRIPLEIRRRSSLRSVRGPGGNSLRRSRCAWHGARRQAKRTW